MMRASERQKVKVKLHTKKKRVFLVDFGHGSRGSLQTDNESEITISQPFLQSEIISK